VGRGGGVVSELEGKLLHTYTGHNPWDRCAHCGRSPEHRIAGEECPARLRETLDIARREAERMVALLHHETTKQARLVAEARARGLDVVADRLACGEAALQCVLDLAGVSGDST
jgi:hypothetical protein